MPSITISLVSRGHQHAFRKSHQLYRLSHLFLFSLFCYSLKVSYICVMNFSPFYPITVSLQLCSY